MKQIILSILTLLFVAGCGAKTEPAPTPIPLDSPVGVTSYCQNIPIFMGEMGFNQPALSTSLPDYVGAVLVDLDGAGNALDVYQHPSWDDAGYLGPITRDANGNLYVSPVPKVSLDLNPLEEQNKIYRIDTVTGEMVEFLDVEGLRPLTASNPFGVIGLTYDCDTNSLYAATLAGSTASEEVGRIVRIDLDTGQPVAALDNMDVIGLGVFNGLTGKRLYYGSARSSDIYSIPLDEQGDFVGESRLEFSLVALEGGGDEKARRISFTRDSMMTITAIDFTYSLHSAIGDEPQTHYKLRYLPDDTWGIVEVSRK